jgi:hypothetical protein
MIKRQLKVLKINAVRAGKTTCKQLRKMTGSNVRVTESGCTRSVLHTKTNASTVVESYSEKKTARCRRGCRIFQKSIRNTVSCVWTDFNLILLWTTQRGDILYNCRIFCSLKQTFEFIGMKYCVRVIYFQFECWYCSFTMNKVQQSSFTYEYIASWIQRRFQRAASIPAKERRLYRHVRERRRKENCFSLPYISETFTSADMLHTT